MIYEYALEPTLLNNWKDFKYLSEKFGYSRGRVISRYPRNWEKMVYDSLDQCPPVEKAKIEIGLKRLKSELHSRFHEWRDGSWLDNAISEHEKRPFRAIIASHNPSDRGFILPEFDLSEDSEPLWKVEIQRRILRTPEEMADCARLLLSCAQKIIFVDPHFNPKESRFRKPLEEFLKVIAVRPHNFGRPVIEYHTGDRSAGISSVFKEECEKHLPKIIPVGLTVRFIRWQQDQLHNRFILTEKAGLQFGIGLDAHNEKPPHEDTVSLLSEQTREKTWSEYQFADPKFPLTEPSFVVKGNL
jgi:hypothetical protein